MGSRPVAAPDPFGIAKDNLPGHQYHSVRRFVARLGAKTPLPFRRLESGPGEEVQVDFGQGAFLVSSDGKRRRPHVFRIVLSHSRKGYSEVVHPLLVDGSVLFLVDDKAEPVVKGAVIAPLPLRYFPRGDDAKITKCVQEMNDKEQQELTSLIDRLDRQCHL